MKRFFTIALITMFVFNSGGYIFLYYHLASCFKENAANNINRFMSDDDLEVIKFDKNAVNSDFAIYNNSEIAYNDKLYDVYKIREDEQCVYYYCLSDKSETKLEFAFKDFVDKNLNKASKENSQDSSLFKLLQNFLIFSENFDAIYKNVEFTSYILYNTTAEFQHYLEVLTPPPINSHLS